MDSGYDYLTPELMHAIFFQQKNVVIFPYLDIKHMRALEVFVIGHSSIELDCTAINDIISILEHQEGTYSQNPPLYFIHNANKNIVESSIKLENLNFIMTKMNYSYAVQSPLTEVIGAVYALSSSM